MGSKCSPCDRAQQHPASGIAENNPACLGLEAGLLFQSDKDNVIREVLLHVKRERVRVTSDSGAQIATRHVRVH